MGQPRGQAQGGRGRARRPQALGDAGGEDARGGQASREHGGRARGRAGCERPAGRPRGPARHPVRLAGLQRARLPGQGARVRHQDAAQGGGPHSAPCGASRAARQTTLAGARHQVRGARRAKTHRGGVQVFRQGAGRQHPLELPRGRQPHHGQRSRPGAGRRPAGRDGAEEGDAWQPDGAGLHRPWRGAFLRGLSGGRPEGRRAPVRAGVHEDGDEDLRAGRRGRPAGEEPAVQGAEPGEAGRRPGSGGSPAGAAGGVGAVSEVCLVSRGPAAPWRGLPLGSCLQLLAAHAAWRPDCLQPAHGVRCCAPSR
mmetsp:Transcript_46858/g.125299  ORF Transcript_46858/g.125299 Transcript_46858/m.125299 type:complete len:311 (+) Transcript_46858:292-1224(+)